MKQEILEGIRRHVQSLEGLEHVQVPEIASDHVKTAWNVHPSTPSLYGSLHGGLISVLCDTAAGMAIYVYEVSNVVQQGCIRLIESVNFGKLYVRAGAVHKENRAAIYHVGVTTLEGKVVANVIFTMLLFDPV